MVALRRTARAVVLALAVAIVSTVDAAGPGAPQRIASTNLCTDSMLFELVDDERIVSVTRLSRDPGMSYFAARAASIPVNHGLAEEIIVQSPDLVLAGQFTAPATAELLARLGYRVESFAPPLGLAEFRESLRAMARVLGREARAEALLAVMDRRLDVIEPGADPKPRALVYRPNGFSPGVRSLANDMLLAAGYANLAAQYGVEYGAFVPLERLVAAAPELLVVDRPSTRSPALADLVLLHEALARSPRATPYHPPRVRVEIAEKYWTCGGTYIVDAVEQLAALRPR